MADRIVLVGSYPPPFGGCSVHVQRLRRALQPDFDVEVIDMYGRTRDPQDASVLRCGGRPVGVLRALQALRRSSASIVHFHVSAMDAFLWASRPMLASLGANARAIITIHGGSFVSSFRSGPTWRRAALQSVLRRFHRIVTVNDEQRRFLEELGIDGGRLKVVPAFLPPFAEESARVREILSPLEGCSPIIISSGYGMRHYGFHIILDALERYCGSRPGSIICTYNSYDESYMAELGKPRSVPCVIARDLNPAEFAWILEKSDTYVRATDRDGDAVAIREALYFGKNAIASDCVHRPPGVVLFRTDDVASLSDALEMTASRPPTPRVHDAGASGLEALLDVYREALCA